MSQNAGGWERRALSRGDKAEPGKAEIERAPETACRELASEVCPGLGHSGKSLTLNPGPPARRDPGPT